jgi:hypothetical protein
LRTKATEFSFFSLVLSADKNYLSKLMFSDKATFYLSRTVNKHRFIIFRTEHSHNTLQHVRGSAKVNVLYALPVKKAYGPLFLLYEQVLLTHNLTCYETG